MTVFIRGLFWITNTEIFYQDLISCTDSATDKYKQEFYALTVKAMHWTFVLTIQLPARSAAFYYKKIKDIQPFFKILYAKATS